MRLSWRGVVGTLFILALAALFVRLGFWQLDRLGQRRARNAAQAAATALPPVALDSATLAAISADPPSFVNRRVTARGTYAPRGEVVLRGRVRDGRPGVHVVTPLLLAGRPEAVLVNRGWLPSPDGATVDAAAFAEPGERTVTGVLQLIPTTDDGGTPARAGNGALTFRRLDLETMRGRAGRPLVPLYVQQLPGLDSLTAGPPHRVPLPALSEGNHLSYAVQWFSFAAIALVGLVILVLRSRPRDPNRTPAPPPRWTPPPHP